MNRQGTARLEALESRVAALESAPAEPDTATGDGPSRPTSADTRATIDAYALDHGIDTSGEANKAAALDLIGLVSGADAE